MLYCKRMHGKSSADCTCTVRCLRPAASCGLTYRRMSRYPSAVATLSRRCRDRIEAAFEASVDEGRQSPLLGSRLHDFGFRGCTGVEQSALKLLALHVACLFWWTASMIWRRCKRGCCSPAWRLCNCVRFPSCAHGRLQSSERGSCMAMAHGCRALRMLGWTRICVNTKLSLRVTRLCTGVLGGVAHLLNFDGTDTLSAAYYAQARAARLLPWLSLDCSILTAVQ